VFQWLKKQGGLEAIEKKNIAKSKLLYDYLDKSPFFKNHVRKSDRSRMNIRSPSPIPSSTASF